MGKRKYAVWAKVIQYLMLLPGFASVCWEIFQGNSLVASFTEIQCPSILSADAILEAVQLVGLSTVLIGVIYRALNQIVLGLSLEELIEQHYYPIPFAAGQIVATVMCVCTAAAGMSESAAYFFLVILVDLCYQARVISRYILRGDFRVTMAEKYWREYAGQQMAPEEKQEKNSDQWKPLFSTLLPPTDKYYRIHLGCVAEVFLSLAYGDMNADQLRQCVDCWKLLLEDRSDQRAQVVAEDLFEQLFEKNRRRPDNQKKALFVIANAYLIYLFDTQVYKLGPDVQDLHSNYSDRRKQEHERIHDTGGQIAIWLSKLLSQLPEDQMDDCRLVQLSVWTSYQLAVWVLFLRGNTLISEDLFPERTLNVKLTDCHRQQICGLGELVIRHLVLNRSGDNDQDLTECIEIAKRQVSIFGSREDGHEKYTCDSVKKEFGRGDSSDEGVAAGSGQ